MSNYSVNRKEVITKNYKVNILGEGSKKYLLSEAGHEMWWFGSDPPGGIPVPSDVIEAITSGKVNEIPPPWAAVIHDPNSNCVYCVTDLVGLQHLFFRHENSTVYVGISGIEIAKTQSCKIDYVGAYELLVRGNPQGGRTIFRSVIHLNPATVVKIDAKISFNQYWSPSIPEPVDKREASEMFQKAVKSAVSRHWHDDDVQELTAGRDSLLILAAHLSNDIPIRTWTHGWQGQADLVGAQKRAKIMKVPHQAVRSEPLMGLSEKEMLALSKEYMMASSALGNVLEYWHLPWILRQVEGNGSITGVGGEVFRGFYYEWLLSSFLPRGIGKHVLLRGKIRDKMPYGHPSIRKKIRQIGDRQIKSDVFGAMMEDPLFWHALDAYYLTGRMHYFAGTTFSAVSNWINVRTPLFDFEVLDCLKYIPVEERGWSAGLVRDVTQNLLGDIEAFRNKSEQSYETLSFRLVRLVKRLKQLKGTTFKGDKANLNRKYLQMESVREIMEYDSLLTRDLYEKGPFGKMVKNALAGGEIPIPLGGMVTVELAARELGTSFDGIEVSI